MGEDESVILDKCIYSLVQATIQYYKKAILFFKKARCSVGNVDACLYIKKGAKVIVYITFYIDDTLLTRNTKAIDEAIEALQKHRLVLKVVEFIL